MVATILVRIILLLFAIDLSKNGRGAMILHLRREMANENCKKMIGLSKF
jgi:hypothetical protein